MQTHLKQFAKNGGVGLFVEEVRLVREHGEHKLAGVIFCCGIHSFITWLKEAEQRGNEHDYTVLQRDHRSTACGLQPESLKERLRFTADT
jgi:hypothetical protein